MKKKSMQKSIKNLMHLKINFWNDFNGFGDGKWSQVGTTIDQKSMPSAKNDFLKNRALAAAGARFFRFWGSKLGVKIDKKSIKKWSQHGKASWHRFVIDPGRFCDPSWKAKSSQDRCKKASRKRLKKEQRLDRNYVTFPPMGGQDRSSASPPWRVLL